MEKITTYYATRKNVLVWLAALLCLVSAVARIIFACTSGIDSLNPVVRIILPVAANLLLAFRLPLRGEKQFYVTILPVLILVWGLCLDGVQAGTGFVIPVVIALCIVFALLYFLTFGGKLSSKVFLLIFFLGAIAAAIMLYGAQGLITDLLGQREASSQALLNPNFKWLLFSDIAFMLSLLFLILCPHKLAPWEEGDPYRLRFGDRLDGRRIRNMPVMSKVTPYFMPTRLGRSNYIRDTIEITNMERYINQKRREGLKHFGITHVLLASYIRTTADMPGLNRFVAGQRVYHRFDTSVNMVVKKEMSKDSPDSSIKVYFSPSDTAAEIYEKFDVAMQNAREAGIANGYDSITHVLDYLPSVVMSLFGFLVRFLDYFGIMPYALERVSPFHGSLFITSMGSLGIPPIYHHLYDLGTVPVFCAFGHKYTRYMPDKNGEIMTKKFIDYTVVCDEGICDGFYYASAMKKWRAYMTHPERLDTPPEVVVEDIY